MTRLCDVTGNPCGTDTRPAGEWCKCDSCGVHADEDQPRYTHREAIEYAKALGLPTDFPL